MGDKDDDEDPGALANTKMPCMPSLVALQQMRNRLHLAYLGKKLMKWSALAAGREMRRVGQLLIENFFLINTSRDSLAYDGFGEECSNAYIMLARCRYHNAILNVVVLENLQKQACITVTTNVKSSGGIKLKIFAIEEQEPAPAAYPHLGIGVGGQLITDTKRAWAALLKKLTWILELRESFVDLDYSFKSSTKKENVLGKLVIPRLNGTIHYILQELEELQREELFRIKKVVQYKTKAKDKKMKKPEPKPEPKPLVNPLKIEPPKEEPPEVVPLIKVPIKEPEKVELPNEIIKQDIKQCCTQPIATQVMPQKVELPKIPAVKPDIQTKMMSTEMPEMMPTKMPKMMSTDIQTKMMSTEMPEMMPTKMPKMMSTEMPKMMPSKMPKMMSSEMSKTCPECIASELPDSCHKCIGLGTWNDKECKSCNILIPKLSDTRSRRLDEFKTEDNLNELLANIIELKLLAEQLHTPSKAKSLKVDFKTGSSKISTFNKRSHTHIENDSKDIDDKSLHDKDVKTLNDQVPQIENPDAKNEISTKTDKFLNACKDFKNRVEELKVNPPKAGTDVNKIMKQLDEAIAISSVAKKSGVNGENVDKFIESCEDLKKLLKKTSSSSSKVSNEIQKPTSTNIFGTCRGCAKPFQKSAQNIEKSKSQGESLNIDSFSQLHNKIINYIRGHGSRQSLVDKSTLSVMSIKKPLCFFRNEQPKSKSTLSITLTNCTKSKENTPLAKSKENMPLAESKTNTLKKKTRSLSNTPLPGSITVIIIEKESSSKLTTPKACCSKSQGNKE